MDENETQRPMGQVIQIDEARIRDHLGEMVRVSLRRPGRAAAAGSARQR